MADDKLALVIVGIILLVAMMARTGRVAASAEVDDRRLRILEGRVSLLEGFATGQQA